MCSTGPPHGRFTLSRCCVQAFWRLRFDFIQQLASIVWPLAGSTLCRHLPLPLPTNGKRALGRPSGRPQIWSASTQNYPMDPRYEKSSGYVHAGVGVFFQKGCACMLVMCMLQVFTGEGGPALPIPGFFFVGCFPPQPMQARKCGFQF